MAVPIYAFNPETLTRALLKALDIKQGRWALCIEYGFQARPGGEVAIAVGGFIIVPYNPALHGHYVDAEEGIEAERIKKGLCPNCGKQWGTDPKPKKERKPYKSRKEKVAEQLDDLVKNLNQKERK